MSEHVWSQENIAAFVAGGLDLTERERLEQHLAACPECAGEVENARALERMLEPLFRAARPGPALEDRLIRALPASSPGTKRSLRLMFRSLSGRAKIALAAAAALLLMALGAGISEVLDDEPGSSRQPGSIAFLFDHSDPMASQDKAKEHSPKMEGDGKNLDFAEIALGSGTMAQYEARIVKSADEMAAELIERSKLSGQSNDVNKRSDESDKSPLLPATESGIAKTFTDGSDNTLRFEARKAKGKALPAEKLNEPSSQKPMAGQGQPGQVEGENMSGEKLAETRKTQTMKLMVAGTPSSGSGSGAGANSQAGELGGKKKEIAWNFQNSNSSKEHAYFMWDEKGKSAETKKAPFGGPGPDSALPSPSMPVPNSALPAPPAPPDAITNGNIPIPPEVTAKLGEKDKESKKGPAPELRIQEANLSQSKIFGLPPKSDPPATPAKPTGVLPGHYNQFMGSIPQPKGAPGETAQPNTMGSPKVDPPAQTVRKVILRSGELEFEVESFDAAVAAIMKLVNATKGGFIATINSEKLPNGKVRGSVVVRVPPEQLDSLVLDLRRDLGKQGELKNQRIGSQDVTKQYTDLESKLRAARTMEDRLLNIIKEGKGQIKDLLLAEKELGVWRTQIEEIEGELRYYSSLATLSTLTLKLHEKNIRSAASITENERIQAGLEVEEVEKAFKDALKIVEEAKGRITRSELKQQSAGQFNAVLHFEVAPDAAGPVRDLLRQLGTMVRLQIDRVQQPGDGGAPPPKDGKIERGNTQFQVSIYNLANIAPRETVILRIAASDVPAAYRKLRDVIAKAKGHVVNAQLNEEDKQKINAQLDFNVRRLAEGEILAALAATGETMTRQVNRVPDADGFTDSKVLFRLSLVDADFIQPRETVTMRIAAEDVKAAYTKLRATLAQAKTRVINADLNEKDKRNISAQFDFTFARTEEGVLRTALALLGETLSHQVTRLADTNNVTDTKVLARIEVVQLDNIQPRETLFVNIAAQDVRQSYFKLQEALLKLKANIINADINEKDRQNVRAVLDFTIRRTDEPAVQTLLSGAGESLSRQSARLADNGNLTDTKVLIRVELFQTDSLPPRETVSLKIAAVDVPAAYQALRTAVAQAKGREAKAELNENDRRNATGLLIFDVPRVAEPALQTLLANLGETLSRQVLRKEETIGVTNAKIGFQIDLKPASLISPRETVTLALEVSNAKAVGELLTLFNADVTEAKGLVVQTQIGQQRNGQVSAHIVYDVPLTLLSTLADKFRTVTGVQVRVHQVERDPQAPEGKLALGRIVVTISNADLLFPTDHGLGSEIRRGFTRSLTGLLRSVSWLFISIFFILPWALLAYAIIWVVRRIMGYGRVKSATSPPTPAA